MNITKRAAGPLALRPVCGSTGRRLASATLIAGLGVCAVTILVPATASADSPSPAFASSNNSSDPYAFRCTRNFVDGYCMVTSEDLGQVPIDKRGSGENYYPMSRTIGYWSTDGLNWSASAVAVTEDQIGRSGVRHLWAPTVRRVKNNGGPVPQSENYLLTPDLTDANDKYSSKIFVTYSTDPIAGYGNTIIRGTGVTSKQINGVGYMSDPEVFVNESDPATAAIANQYLLWADGDAASCGGMSLRKMDSQSSVVPFSNPNQAWLTINGPIDDELGTCTKKAVGGGGGPVGTVVPRPYLEGGSLFRSANWASGVRHRLPGPYVLMFAAKPENTPRVCQQPGQPNSANEVIAYATANSVTGPYTYQGIIMCGSDSEWTNQATIEEVTGADGQPHLLLIHHDGVVTNDTRNRKLHAECLMTDGNGRFALVTRSPDGAAASNGSRAWCLSQPRAIVSLKSVTRNQYVSAPVNGQLAATSNVVGLTEQFSQQYPDNVAYIGYNTRTQGNLWIQANRNVSGRPVMNRGAALGPWEKMHTSQVDEDTRYIRIRDDDGYYWRADAQGNISAPTQTPSATDKSFWFDLEYLW